MSPRPPAPRSIGSGDSAWPERLGHLDRPPQALWVWGRDPVAGVAVVGSRRATLGGLAIARDIGQALAEHGVPVISGMARGIDAAAHGGCLDAGGFPVAVLGCGIDVCYPPDNEPLRDRIVAAGCVLSEEAPGTPPLRANFPKRNRLIAALALAVVVVEATARSGALSTARWAADLGREVLAVPGSIRSPASRGTNLLICDGVRPYLEIGDLAEAVPGLLDGDGRSGHHDEAGASSGLSRSGAEILRAMGADPVHPDELGHALGLAAPAVAAALATLELSGHLMSLPGGLVARTFRDRSRL